MSAPQTDNKDAEITRLRAEVERLTREHVCPDCGHVTTNRCLADLSSRMKEAEAVVRAAEAEHLTGHQQSAEFVRGCDVCAALATYREQA